MKSTLVFFCVLVALSIGGYFFVSEAMAATPVQGETQNGVVLKLVGSSANQNSAGGLAGGYAGGSAGANIRVAQY